MKGKLFIGLVFILASCLDDSIISVQEQLNRDIKKIDQYLADNGILDVIKDASGVRIVITSLGDEGLPANIGNTLKINYTGRLLSNGAIFDQGTYLQNLETSILGWQIALPMLPEGTFAILYIPSIYGYGSQGNSGIPKNACLVFDVEVERVDLSAAQETKLGSDGTIIDNFLASKGVTTAITHPSGLRYEILAPGTGSTPDQFSPVTVKFVGQLIPTETEFGNTTIQPTLAFSSRVANFLNAWQVALPLIKEGGKIRIYSPSVLGYGNVTQGNIPANSNLYFELELIDVGTN